MSVTDVRFFNSAMPGAPVMSGTAGALKQVLDACLIDGFGLSPVGTLTVGSGVATLSWGTAHGFPLHSIVRIAGATEPSLNGDKRVIFTSTNTLRFAAVGVADGNYGTRETARFAPENNWTRLYEDTNRAVYNSQHPLATQNVLAVDDTTTTHATLTAADGAFGVSDLVMPWGSRFWFKSSTANSTPVAWDLVCDSRTIYISIQAGQNWGVYGFGDYESFLPNDPFAAFLTGYTTSTLNSSSNRHSWSLNHISSGTNAHGQLRLSSNSGRTTRGALGVLAPSGMALLSGTGAPLLFVSGAAAATDGTDLTQPRQFNLTAGLSGFNSTVVLSRPLVRQTEGNTVLLGRIRGLHHVLGEMASSITARRVFSSRNDGALVYFVLSFAKNPSGLDAVLSNPGLQNSLIAFQVSGSW